ncbi:MAG: M24 family metallopeptidase, partial [Candidatus Latescibacterota bacterium]|nr:M24 family metallopeptidase [Candidatus Latescibacterota bacterium]
GALLLDGAILTSERLRRRVHRTLMDCDSLGEHTIIAGGDQGCDPHQVGFGPLRACETIVIDIFPRDETSGYFGDLTRTVCKGQASEAMLRLYQTVLEAQQLGLEIHERPSIGRRDEVLGSGHIVTMEPGLYYRGTGGVRIEDTVVVCEGGYENLTTLPKVFEV